MPKLNAMRLASIAFATILAAAALLITPAADAYTLTGPTSTGTVNMLSETNWGVQKNGNLILTAYPSASQLLTVDFSANGGNSFTTYTCATCSTFPSSIQYGDFQTFPFTATTWSVIARQVTSGSIGPTVHWRTTDGGSTWTTTTSFTTSYACSPGGTSSSTGSGVGIQSTINGGSAAFTIVHPSNAGTCTLGTGSACSEVIATTNSGLTWTSMNGNIGCSFAGQGCSYLSPGTFMWESSVNLFLAATLYTGSSGATCPSRLATHRSTNMNPLAIQDNDVTALANGGAPPSTLFPQLRVASTDATALSWIDANGQWAAKRSASGIWDFKNLGSATAINGRSHIEVCPSGKAFVFTNGMVSGDTRLKVRAQTNAFTDAWTETGLTAATTDGTQQQYAFFRTGTDGWFFAGKQSSPYRVEMYRIANVCDGVGGTPAGSGSTVSTYSIQEIFCSAKANTNFGYNYKEGVIDFDNRLQFDPSTQIDHGMIFRGDSTDYDYLAKTFTPATASKGMRVMFRIESNIEVAGNSVFRAGFSFINHVSAGWQNSDLTLTTAAKGHGGNPDPPPIDGAFEDYIEARFEERDDDWYIRVYLYYAGSRVQLGSGVHIDDPDEATYYMFEVDTTGANPYYKVKRLVNTGNEYTAQTISNGPLERRLSTSDNPGGDPPYGNPGGPNSMTYIHDRLIYSQWFVGHSTSIAIASTLLDNGNREHTSPSTCIYDLYGIAVAEGDQGDSGPRSGGNGSVEVISDPGNAAAPTGAPSDDSWLAGASSTVKMWVGMALLLGFILLGRRKFGLDPETTKLGVLVFWIILSWIDLLPMKTLIAAGIIGVIFYGKQIAKVFG